MDADWFCQMGGRDYGPLNLEQIRRMVARGQVTPESLVRQGKGGSWVPATQVSGLFVTPVARVVGSAANVPAVPLAPPAPVANAPATPISVPPVPARAVAVSPIAFAPVAVAPGAPLPVGLPVGVAIAPVAAVSAVPVGQPVMSVVPFATETKTASKGTLRRKRKDSLPMILMGVAGVALVVLAIVAFAVMGGGGKPVAKLDGGQRAAAKKVADDDQTPTAASGDKRVVAKATAAAMSPDKILNSIERWSDAAKARTLQGKSFQVKLVGVWDGPDGLCVGLQIKNLPTASETLTYSGWNRTSGTLAILADDAGQTYSLLPVKGGDADRKTSPVKLRPGQTVEDVLVFAKPPDDVESLRLALSREVVGQGGDQYFGFKIPKSFVSDERPEPELASSDMPESRATAERAPRDPNEPPSLADLQRRMEKDVKSDEDAKEKARQARAAEIEKEAKEMDADKKGSKADSPK